MSSLGDTAQIIGACVLAFNAYQSWRNGRIAKKAVAKIEETKAVIEVVAAQTNGINAHLVAVVGEAKYAEGLKAGEESGKNGS